MDFPDLITDFAKRHGIEGLTADDGAAAETDVAEAPSFGASSFVQV